MNGIKTLHFITLYVFPASEKYHDPASCNIYTKQKTTICPTAGKLSLQSSRALFSRYTAAASLIVVLLF
jgi:hypothetical protein